MFTIVNILYSTLRGKHMFNEFGCHFGTLEANSDLLKLQIEHLYRKALTQKWGTEAAEIRFKHFQAETGQGPFSDYLLRHEPSSKNAGFFRLVPASSDFNVLPCEQKLAQMGHAFWGQYTLYSRHLLAEISGFTVAPDFCSVNTEQQEKYNVSFMLYLTALAVLYQGRYKYACMLLEPDLLELFTQHGMYLLQRSSEIEGESIQVLVMLDVRDSVDALQDEDVKTFEQMLRDLEQRTRLPEWNRQPELGRFSLAS